MLLVMIFIVILLGFDVLPNDEAQPPKAYGTTSLKGRLYGAARQDGMDNTDGLWVGCIRG